jgi:hypothetical protein
LSLFHTKAKTRKESIWGPFAHNKWVAFSNEEYTPNTNCVFLFTLCSKPHSILCRPSLVPSFLVP